MVLSSQQCFSENSTCAEKNWQQNGVRPETWILKLKGELRPVSATEMIGGIENSDFARSRAETFRGLPSCFCESVTRRPVTTVFLAKSKGGSFLKSWTLSIATSVSEKKHCVFHKTWMKHLWAIPFLYEAWRPASYVHSEFYGNPAKW